MKPRNFFRPALLFPYLLWGVCALIVFLLSSQEISEAWNIVLRPVFFYAFGIILWFVPYTVLAIGMWIWSRKKSTTALYRTALIAPILLLVLMIIEVVAVSLPIDSMAQLTEELLGQSALVGGFSLVFGYFCVGIALGLFRFLKSRNRILEGTVPSQQTV